MLSGSSALVATRSMRAALERQHDARLLAEDAEPAAGTKLGVRHLPRERLSLERQPADRVHVAQRETPVLLDESHVDPVEPGANDRHDGAGVGLDGLRAGLRDALERREEPDLLLLRHVREAPARTLSWRSWMMMRVGLRCTSARAESCSTCSTSVPSGSVTVTSSKLMRGRAPAHQRDQGAPAPVTAADVRCARASRASRARPAGRSGRPGSRSARRPR